MAAKRKGACAALLALCLSVSCAAERLEEAQGAFGAPVLQQVGLAGVVSEPSDEAAKVVFDGSTLRTYDLTVNARDLAALNALPIAETYVPATL